MKGVIFMDFGSRRQYLMQLREKYIRASKKDKTRILDEYIKNTGHNRKYTIAVLNSVSAWDPNSPGKKKRRRKYGSQVDHPLTLLWKIFDFPCGQRLKPCITAELNRLRGFGEINVSDEVANLLLAISSATIDRLLKPKKILKRRQGFSTTRPGSLLKAKIPVRLTDWDTAKIGFLETDLVAHCGGSIFGQYVNTVSLTEIATGWWEGQAIMGKGQNSVLNALKSMRSRTPFPWKGLDSDNGSEFINYPLWYYCNNGDLIFTRSRENKKNDNAYVEQKNWTHVRKLLSYFRYDTQKELSIINDLYLNEVRLYKNFFQPVMKLSKKVRIGSKRKRQYEEAKTPFKRIIESDQIDQKTKDNLLPLYNSLNPAAIKRIIDSKILSLFHSYQDKLKPLPPSRSVRILHRKEVAMVRF
jgi:hypothetical protein